MKVIYSAIVALDNAYCYCQKDGITYYFHTAESNHKNFPHIHVQYAGEEISISLTNFDVIGSFKNCRKQKKAESYVREHVDELMIEWHKIIHA